MAALVLPHATVQADVTGHASRTYPGWKIKADTSAVQYLFKRTELVQEDSYGLLLQKEEHAKPK